MASAQPSDDDRNSARVLGEEANTLFKEGAYAEALDRYRRAEALVPVPTLGLRIAHCLEKLGRLVEASEKYVAVTRTELAADALPQHVEAVARAREELGALQPRVPGLVVRLDPPSAAGVTVWIDDRALPAALIGARRSVDPGRRRVVARRADRSVAKDVDVTEGQTLEVVLVLGAPPPDALPKDGAPITGDATVPLRAAATIAFVASAAGVVTFAAAGLDGVSRRSDLERACGPKLLCPGHLGDDVDTYNQRRLASTIGLWVGVGLGAVGTALLVPTFVTSRSEVAVGLAPLGLRVKGSW